MEIDCHNRAKCNTAGCCVTVVSSPPLAGDLASTCQLTVPASAMVRPPTASPLRLLVCFHCLVSLPPREQLLQLASPPELKWVLGLQGIHS